MRAIVRTPDNVFRRWYPEFKTFGAGVSNTTTPDAEQHARDFGLVTPNSGSSGSTGISAAQAAAMRVVNPNVKLLGYGIHGQLINEQSGDPLGFPADAYLRDTEDTSGGICYSVGGYRIAKPYHPVWIAALRALYTAGAYSPAVRTYDGVLLDVMGKVMWGTSGSGMAPRPWDSVRRVTDWEIATAVEHATNLTHQVTQAVGALDLDDPYQCFVNGIDDATAYFGVDGDNAATSRLLDGCNGAMCENFLRAKTATVTSFTSGAWATDWHYSPEMLIDAETNNKPIFCETWLGVTATDAQSKQWQKLSLGTFLLGAGGWAHWSFHHDLPAARVRQFATLYYPSDAWWARVDGLGAPTDNFTVANFDTVNGAKKTANGKTYYQRIFANGRVLVNPTATNITSGDGITAPYACMDVDGTVFASGAAVDLSAQTGRVLLKQ